MIQRCTAALYRNPTVLSATVLAGAVLALRPCGLRISKGAAKTYNTAVQRNLKNARVHAPLRRFNLARGSSTFVWLGDASTVSVPRAPELLDCFYFAGEILGGPPHHGTTTTCTCAEHIADTQLFRMLRCGSPLFSSRVNPCGIRCLSESLSPDRSARSR